MKACDIISALEEFAPLSAKEEWDNTGLSVGDPSREISAVMLSLDCTEAVIDEAISRGAEMVVTHHPLIFSPLKQISTEEAIGRMILKAAKNDMVIYSAHTNMDKVSGGVSGIMAQKLMLRDVQILSAEADTTYGLGVVGNLPSPLDFEEIVAVLKTKFGAKVLKCSGNNKGKVSRIALCGGSGSSLIPYAEKAGADLFITGDISYHHFIRDGKTAIIDIGHFESESGILDLIKTLLTKKFTNFAVLIAENNINPIQYY